jgi:hypothetical protein
VVETDVVFQTLEVTETIMVLENKDMQWQHNPWEIKSQYLDKMSYPTPEGKNRYIYEAILSDAGSGSVQFHHTYDCKQDQTSPISYSKAVIKAVSPIQRWGINPQKSKVLNIKTENRVPFQYNYWDYIEAFTKAFYYQNEKRKHSWFLKLCPYILTQDKEYPNWFYTWWSKFGPKPEYLPNEIQLALKPFTQLYSQLRGEYVNKPEGRLFLETMTIFGIPWIWKWDVTIGSNQLQLPTLQRTFHCRWWKGADTNETLERIKAKVAELKVHVQQQEKLSIKNPFLEISAQLKTKFPNASDDELIVKTMSFMKEQFLQTISTEVADDESMASASSKDDTNNPFTCLAGEAQDPYEDELSQEIPTLGDVWDSMTEIVADKLSSKKGKEKMG